MALQSNGLLDRAGQAREAHLQGEKNDSAVFEEIDGEIAKLMGEAIPYTDPKGNVVKIPTGYSKSSESPDYVSDGIIIEDSELNQYVWVPVGRVTKKDGEEVEIKLIRNDYTTSGTLIKNAETEEPEEPIVRYYIEKIKYRLAYNHWGTTAKDINMFIQSAKDNGGYYLARYEAGIEANMDQWTHAGFTKNYPAAPTAAYEKKVFAKDGSFKPLSRAGVGVWNAVTQPEAASICQNADFGSGVIGDLCNSFAWDTTIDFIQKCGTETNSNRYVRTEGKSKTSTSEPQTTGTNILNQTSTEDVQCNIYDMAGNCTEWTTETYDRASTNCVHRGGRFDGNQICGLRMSNYEDTAAIAFGFRVVLYLV